jgi:hypothetical protein
MKPIIKYYRFEDNTFILIPTKEGLEKAADFKFKTTQDNRKYEYILEETEEAVGTTKIIAFKTEFPAKIKHVDVSQNPAINEFNCRVFTENGVNYYLKLKYYAS